VLRYVRTVWDEREGRCSAASGPTRRPHLNVGMEAEVPSRPEVSLAFQANGPDANPENF
jgi:hypothetical protein